MSFILVYLYAVQLYKLSKRLDPKRKSSDVLVIIIESPQLIDYIYDHIGHTARIQFFIFYVADDAGLLTTQSSSQVLSWGMKPQQVCMGKPNLGTYSELSVLCTELSDLDCRRPTSSLAMCSLQNTKNNVS